jgi:uncharacterized protein (TIGR02217 family)
LDTTTGIITFYSGSIPALGDVITATFEFDTPARFDTDQMDIDLVAFDLNTWGGISIVELSETTTT